MPKQVRHDRGELIRHPELVSGSHYLCMVKGLDCAMPKQVRHDKGELIRHPELVSGSHYFCMVKGLDYAMPKQVRHDRRDLHYLCMVKRLDCAMPKLSCSTRRKRVADFVLHSLLARAVRHDGGIYCCVQNMRHYKVLNILSPASPRPGII